MTEVEEVRLFTERRAVKREVFDKTVEGKLKEKEDRRNKEEEERRRREREEMSKSLRRPLYVKVVRRSPVREISRVGRV